MFQRNSDKLQNARKSLEEAIKYSRSAEFQELGSEFKTVLQAAVVQNFSLTFKVCMQMFTYQLADLRGKAAVLGQTPDAILRMAGEEKLMTNVDRWLEYLDCEYLTHSSTLAVRTFEKASAFLDDAAELLSTCCRRNHNERRAA